MAAIHDLINQIQDPALRAKIEQEVEKLTKQKKFGLVFEEHLPECTLLYDIPVRKGLKVSVRDGKANETYNGPSSCGRCRWSRRTFTMPIC